jgi:hypothetical protein
MSQSIRPLVSARWKKIAGLCALALCLAASMSLVFAQATNAAPATSTTSSATTTTNAAPASSEEAFGAYLVEHQNDLAPFFNEKGDEIARQAAPLLQALVGKIMIFTLFTCWVFDVAMIRWFSVRFAPSLAKFKRALIYATGRLVLSVLFYSLLGLAILMISGLGHEAIVVTVLFFVFLAIELGVQTGWVHYLYSTPVPRAFLCYICIFGVHVLTGAAVSAPILLGHASDLVTAYVDGNITPKLQAATAEERLELSTTTTSRDSLKAKSEDARGTIAANTAEQDQLQKQIDTAKNSDTYLFSRAAQLRAQGDLATARDRFADLSNKFPNSPLAAAMKTQLAAIDSDLAAQAAKKQQDEVDAAAAVAKARADLLAHASQGQATLSEMRLALVGKKEADIKALFGQPSAIASDRWGYDQLMIINPITQHKFGLAVYFLEGTVQGVDYFYGTAAPASGSTDGGGIQ